VPVASDLVKPRIYTKKGDDGTTGLLRAVQSALRSRESGVVSPRGPEQALTPQADPVTSG
jgi:hypothetical protein